jgi:hypothetical protein
MPCGYYQFVRNTCLVGFSILVYQANQESKQTSIDVQKTRDGQIKKESNIVIRFK